MDQPEKERHMLPQLFQALALPLRLAVADADQGQHRGHTQHGQRLSTLFSFINNEFALDKLTILKDKNGSRFADLTPLEQNKIEDCAHRMHLSHVSGVSKSICRRYSLSSSGGRAVIRSPFIEMAS